jgi:hypothetical protein
VDLLADATRTIGTIDPLLREQHIGTGCALENLLSAAAFGGFAVKDLNYDDDPSTAGIASVMFEQKRPQQSALCLAIPHRHTNRGPYHEHQIVPAELIRVMERLNTEPEAIQLMLWTGPQSSRRIRDLIVAASEALVADRAQSRDSARWYRGTRDEIERQRDGITIDAQGLSPVLAFIAKLLPEPSESTTDRVFLHRTKTVHCGPGAIFATIAVRDPARKDVRVRVGRLWQRIHLWGTANGIAMQPLNQIHERMDRETAMQIPARFTQDVAGLIGEPNWHAVFTFRMGYAASPAKPSPRRDLAQVLV